MPRPNRSGRATPRSGSDHPVCPWCSRKDENAFELGLVAGKRQEVSCEGCLRLYYVEIGPSPGKFQTSRNPERSADILAEVRDGEISRRQFLDAYRLQTFRSIPVVPRTAS